MIDKLLNKVTTYRLVVYYLIALLVAGLVFGALGWIPVSPLALLATTAALLAASLLANFVLAGLLRVAANQESTIITALILALIIGPADPIADPLHVGIVALAGIMAIASKYLLAFKRHHLFNPAALGVLLSGLVFQEYASWWVGQQILLPIVVVGGLLLARKINRIRFVALFLGMLAALLVGDNLIQGLAGGDILQNLGFLFLQSEVPFLAFVMLTEPITSPKRFRSQVWYLLAVAFFTLPQLSFFGLDFSPELALVLGNLVAFFISPKGRHRLVLKEQRSIGRETVEFRFERPKGLRFKAGQYMEFTLPLDKLDSRGNRRYLSIASSPDEQDLLIAARFPAKPSAFKTRMLTMEKGDVILASELSGDFVLPANDPRDLVLIAGGIGITPFRSMIKELSAAKSPRKLTLFFSNSGHPDIVYDEVFAEAEKLIDARIVHTLTRPDDIPASWTGERGRIDADMLRRHLPEPGKARYFVSGSPGFVDQVASALRHLGVSRWHIHTDFFPGY